MKYIMDRKFKAKLGTFLFLVLIFFKVLQQPFYYESQVVTKSLRSIYDNYILKIKCSNKDNKTHANRKSTNMENSVFYINLQEMRVAGVDKDGYVNVKQFGAYGDGIHDDTYAIQKAINAGKTIFFPNGKFLVSIQNNNTAAITIPSNRNIIMSPNCIINLAANDFKNYQIFYINDSSNILIEGGQLIGDRVIHIGTEGEWGHCLRIYGDSSNIIIRNVVLKNAWGDGVAITGPDGHPPKNILIENCICDNNRRQGMSVGNVDGLTVNDSKFINTNGTAPQSGIDFEPDRPKEIINNVVLNNVYTYNNNGNGILIAYQKDSITPVDITINNWHNDSNNNVNSKHGLFIAGNAPSGRIVINHSLTENNYTNSIAFRNTYEGAKIYLNNFHIHNPNTSGNQDSYKNEYCLIYDVDNIYYKSKKTIGGIHINGLTITADSSNLQGTNPFMIYMRFLPYKDISIKNIEMH